MKVEFHWLAMADEYDFEDTPEALQDVICTWVRLEYWNKPVTAEDRCR